MEASVLTGSVAGWHMWDTSACRPTVGTETAVGRLCWERQVGARVSLICQGVHPGKREGRTEIGGGDDECENLLPLYDKCALCE